MQFRIAFNPQKETEKRERFHFDFPSQTPEHTSGYVCSRVCLSVFRVCVRVYKRVRDANCEVTGLILFIAALFLLLLLLLSFPLRLTAMLRRDSVKDKPLRDSIHYQCTSLGTKLRAALAPGNINAPFKPPRICP